MIKIPLGLLLVTGLFEAEPTMKLLIVSADIALITLIILSFKAKTKVTLIIEIASFILMLLPILKLLLSFSFEWFNYFLFLFPASCFIIFFPLSIFFSYRNLSLK